MTHAAPTDAGTADDATAAASTADTTAADATAAASTADATAAFDPAAFRLTEGEAALAARVREFGRTVLAPRAARWDREASFPTEHYRDMHEAGLLGVLGREGIGCIPFSPLAQGLLTGRYLADIPPDSRAAKPTGFLQASEVTDARRAQLRALAAVAERRGQTLAQLALAWVLRQPAVTSALIGASRVGQIEDAVGALDNLAFAGDELAEIDRLLAGAA